MKRKTILSFITGLFLLGGLSSCMDLDETVYDKLPADDFGQSTAELNALIGNSHNTMKKFWTEYMHLSECSGSFIITRLMLLMPSDSIRSQLVSPTKS